MSLLSHAAELEERDANVAARLSQVEVERAELESRRARAMRLADLLAWLPQAASENEVALGRASRRRDAAANAVTASEERERLAAESALAAADAEVARLEEHRRAFAQRSDEVRDAVAGLAADLGTTGLDDTLELLSRRRGALLVEHSSLAREREAVVREASELLGAVTGDPLAATSVAGLRERLERALP